MEELKQDRCIDEQRRGLLICYFIIPAEKGKT
jgi:hypothetical protein